MAATEGPPVDLNMTWSSTALPQPTKTAAAVIPTGLVSFHGSYVAVGTVWVGALYDCGCGGPDALNNRGLVWTSADGHSWTLHDGIAAFAHSSPIGLVTDGMRLVAYGAYTPPVTGEYYQPVGATWVSTDGITWTRSSSLAPWAVVVADGRFVGATSMVRNSESIVTPETSTVSFVSSTDGLHWTSTSPTFDAYLGYQSLGAGLSPEQVLAVSGSGAAMAIGEGPPDAVAWQSSDGLRWSGPERLVPDVHPKAIAAAGDSFLVAAWGPLSDNGDGYGQIWRYSPGTGSIVPVLSTGPSDIIEEIIDAGAFIVASGESATQRLAWASTNGGATFSPLVGQTPFTSWSVSGVTQDPEGLLVLGTATYEPATPTVWLGR